MQVKELEDNLIQSIQNFKESTPELSLSILAKLLSSFVTTLKNYLENYSEKRFDWNDIIVKLEYNVKQDEEGGETIFLKDDIENQDNYIGNIVEKTYLEIFKAITKNVSTQIEKNNSRHNTPPEILQEIKKFSLEEQFNQIEKLFNIEPLIIKPNPDKPAVIIKFHPLIMDIDNNRNYYKVTLKTDVGNSKPSKWKDEAKSVFWSSILEHIARLSGGYSLNLESGGDLIQPRSELKTININNQLIKTSLHTELQKFGSKPKKQGTIFEILPNPLEDEVNTDIFEYRIEVIGIDNTKAENQSLFAIQKLLHETGYKGNTEGKVMEKDDNSFKFIGYLPIIQFTPAHYLEAYGVSKRETARGKWEFNANERSEALKALRELSQKKYLFHYKKKYWKDGKELYDLITTVRSLFNLTEKFEAINQTEVDMIESSERNLKTDEKLGFIVLEPCPLLVDQIETYFVLKPANFYQEIKLLVGKTSKQVPLFIDFLIAEITKREISSKGKEIDWTIELNYETLAYKLRMDKMIEASKVKRIKQELEKCYEIAMKLGYLLEHKTIMGTTVELEQLVLNPDKFKRVKEINEEIKQIDSSSKFY